VTVGCRYSERMRVKLLYFGVLKDLLGTREEEVETPEGATVGDLLRILGGRTSNVRMEARILQSMAVAVNRQYQTVECVLRDGDEVALLPPVSGGCRAPLLADEMGGTVYESGRRC